MPKASDEAMPDTVMGPATTGVPKASKEVIDVAMSQISKGKYVYYYYSDAPTTIASEITASVTSISVKAGEGVKLPLADFHIEIDNEIIKCTSRATDVLTVVRGQRSTTGAAHSSGASVHRMRGWWNYFCKATDGSGATAKKVITYGSFKLV
ncbi:unnamed protein product [marine sediment metagenome]|uniref:Uncharacterized protein n=1 Tax=marine sediment metagenome TaxID=412755 RepID=X1DET3_9ZZZZ